MKTAVVISVCGRVDMLDLNLHSHALFTPKDFALIVADASVDGSAKAVAERYQVSYVPTPGTPHPRTMHAGILLARDLGAEFVVQSNDDLVVTEGWNRSFFNEWEFLEQKHGKVGMLGASTNYIAGPQCRITGEFGSSEVREVKVVRAFFAMHRVASYFEVGGYPLDTPGSWFGDDVLALRFLRAGYRSFVSSLFIPHFGSATMRGRDLSDEKMRGEFYMSRYFKGWKQELYSPLKPAEPAPTEPDPAPKS